MPSFTKAIGLNSFNAYNIQSYGVLNSYWNGWGTTYGFFGNRPAVPCRYASAFRITTPSFSGNATSITVSFFGELSYSSTVTARLSLTTTDPSTTDAYVNTTLGDDSGRIATEDITFSGLSSTATVYTFTLNSSSIQGNSTYYVVVSPYTSSNSNYAKIPSASLSGYVTYEADATTVSADNGNIGSSIGIYMTDDGMSHSLSYSFEGSTGSIGATTGSVFYWSVPASLANKIPSSTTGTCTITCTSDAGSSTTTTTLTVPDTSTFRPSITQKNIALDNSSSETVAGWKIYLQGYSKLVATLKASAGYSTIASWRIDYGSQSFSGSASSSTIDISQTSQILSSAGTFQVSVSVTDARGRTTTVTNFASYTVESYSNPTVTDAVMYRCDSEGNPSPEGGTYLYSNGTPVISSCDGHNTSEIWFEYKKRSESTYIHADINTVVGDGQIDVLTSYNMRIVVQDSLNTFYSDAIVPTQSVSMNIKPAAEGGVCFGGYAQYDKKVELADGWKLQLTNLDDIMIGNTPLSQLIGGAEKAYPVGSIYISTASTNPATSLGFGTWEQIRDTFLLACGSSYLAGATGGEATHALTAAELASHAHGLNSHTHTGPSHSHTMNHGHGDNFSISGGGSHTHSVSGTSAGSYPKGFMIRDTGTPQGTGSGYVNMNMGSSYAGVSVATSITSGSGGSAPSLSGSVSSYSGSTGDGGTGNTGAATGNTASSGSGTAHNNMPPYLAVYVWKRTA